MNNLRLRQICLVARDKSKIVEEFADVLDVRPVHGSGDLVAYGLPARGPMFEGGHKMLETLGVENLIFGAGADFIEVLFPTRSDGSTVRLMERRGGDTGYMLILQDDDIEPFVRRGEQAGIRIIHQADFPQYRDVHFHPKDTGGALLSVARHMPDNIVDGPWYPAGTAWETLPRSRIVTGIAAVELQSPDPQVLAERWGRILGRPIERDGENWLIALDDGVLRFVPAADGRGEGFSGFDLRVRDRRSVTSTAARHGLHHDESRVTMCGMRIGLVEE